MIDSLGQRETLSWLYYCVTQGTGRRVKPEHLVRIADYPVAGLDPALAQYPLALAYLGKGASQAVVQRGHAQHLSDAAGNLPARLAHTGPANILRIGDIDDSHTVRPIPLAENGIEGGLQVDAYAGFGKL